MFDLECSRGHTFEGWFDSLEAFEEQQIKKMITCPFCDDIEIRKVLSPVSVSSGSSRPVPQGAIDYKKLAMEVSDYMQKNFEDVGTKFAAEALKMHYGVSEKRNIRGSATQEEENTLASEGVEFFKVPLPKTDDKKKN